MSKTSRMFVVTAILAFAGRAWSADIYMQLQRGGRAVLALTDFSSKDTAGSDHARLLQSVAKQDILNSGLFNLQEGAAPGEGKIDFNTWAKQGADVLVTANISLKSEPGKEEGMVQMVASVYELPSGNPVFQKMYRTVPKNARRLAHEFVADLLYRFTGDRGVSQTRIVFSNNATGAKELYVIDQDGENLRRITANKSLNLLPRWSPDGREIIFTSYKRGNPDLYTYSFQEGLTKIFSERKGLNSAACFSPDGTHVLATLSFQGAPNLYLLDRKGEVIRRFTSDRFAETSPCFSPDGRKVAFVSDRPGWPQIYLMDLDGGNTTRLTESGHCDAPSWSPRGDKIAYSRGSRAQHDIIVHDLSTGQDLQITRGMGSNENPSFSPDGRFIVFTSSRNKKRELYVASVDGAVQRKVADIPGECFTPAWGMQ